MKSLKKCGGKSGKFGKELLLPFCSYSDANAMLMIFLKGHRAAEMHAAIVQEQQYIMA